MRLLQLGLTVCALAAAMPAAAQVFRWVDDRGVVNYGNKPPEKASRVVRVDTQDRVSIIPTAIPSAPAPNVARLPTAPAGFPGVVDQSTVGLLQSGAPDWRERCFAQRRVDCNTPTAATFDAMPSFSPSLAFGPMPTP